MFKNEEFEILYQPKVDINSEKIVSAEALIRWKHKDVGYISPNIFIPIAEKNGDINLIGRWVIKEVCKEIKKCEVNKDNIVPIAINLSRVELYQNNLIDYIRNTMKRYDISPEYLEFEITETAALNDIDYINNRIRDIKSLGIKVSMDDFGTGSSNLSNLKRLDIDVLKIDRTLSIDIEEDEKTKSLLKAIINLAKEYNIDVVCEGIESREQVDILREFRCDMVQGYVYYRPLDICKLKKILKGNK
ncbi:EAL domain-containing protein [Romboutsia hominis]|uniref:EAL domain-containing protein n=1 Tax=Romboutsia hominis TaxID=1507512 RepID=UPI000B81738D|nr:EAL domain-containing protein [Romboutsia hominis]